MLTTAKKPRISVNKLAEYLEASPVRRKKIIADAKAPAKFITTRYANARDVIKNYLISGQDEDYVLREIKEIEKIEPKSEFQEQDKSLSIESLEILLETDFAVLEGCDIANFDDANPLIEIAGVAISVNPDLVLTKRLGDITHIGGVKLHLSKSNLLTSESQKIVGVLSGNKLTVFHPKYCPYARPHSRSAATLSVQRATARNGRIPDSLRRRRTKSGHG